MTDANNSSVKGVHYYLPKPFLQVAPQADGTIAVDVIYLPDKSHEYAINTSSALSAYTFQVARDEKGLITSIEYKANTAIVGQQLAASAGALAAQTYNIKAAQLAANQSQINTTQAAADSALATYLAAKAKLASDTGHSGVSPATLNDDQAAVAQAEAKLHIAQRAAQRAQETDQAVSTPVAAGTITPTTSPTIANVWGQPTWNASQIYSLPQMYGAVLFAVNDDGKKIELKAVKSKIGQAKSDNTQPSFETVSTALGPPTLLPLKQTPPPSVKQLVFTFDRAVEAKGFTSQVTTDAVPPVAAKAPVKVSDGTSVTVDTSSLDPGDYVLDVTFNYVVTANRQTMSAHQQVKFTLKAN